MVLGARDDGIYVIELFRNLGDGTFAKVNSGIPQLAGDTIAWGDYDLDGYLDVLMTGEKVISSTPDVVNRSLYVFINNRHGTFAPLNLGLPEVWSSASGWRISTMMAPWISWCRA
jgi:hypothetical protein